MDNKDEFIKLFKELEEINKTKERKWFLYFSPKNYDRFNELLKEEAEKYIRKNVMEFNKEHDMNFYYKK